MVSLFFFRLYYFWLFVCLFVFCFFLYFYFLYLEHLHLCFVIKFWNSSYGKVFGIFHFINYESGSTFYSHVENICMTASFLIKLVCLCHFSLNYLYQAKRVSDYVSCVLWVSIVPLHLRFYDWILKLFTRCGNLFLFNKIIYIA